MHALDILKLIGLAQGAFVLGVTFGILYYYIHRSVVERMVLWHLLSIIVSYILVTIGTVITASRQIYQPLDRWYFFVFVGYAFGDFALVIIFKHQLQKHREEKLSREIDAEKDKRYKEALERKKRQLEQLKRDGSI